MAEKNSIGEYKFLSEINWEEETKVLNTDKSNNQIYVNKSFEDKSVFGEFCIFIKCKFGSGCELLKPYWDEEGKHE